MDFEFLHPKVNFVAVKRDFSVCVLPPFGYIIFVTFDLLNVLIFIEFFVIVLFHSFSFVLATVLVLQVVDYNKVFKYQLKSTFF